MIDVPVGYKQTDVGIIPEDWKTVSLGDLTTLMTNGFVGTATRHYVENENGVLYIQGYNVEENSFNFHGIKYVSVDFHKDNMKSCLRHGDLLTVQTGDVGLTTVISEELAGSNCHALIISRFDKKYVEPKFASYYLNSAFGRSRLRLIETGTTMKHLNVGDMLQFLIPLPPTKSEQTAIATALSDVDTLLNQLDKLIAKKRDIKQATMQQLLTGKKRLAGFGDGKGYKQTEMGEIPEDWEIAKLHEVSSISSGTTPSRDAYNRYFHNGTIAWIKTLDLNNGEIKTTEECITPLALSETSLKCSPIGAVVVAMYGGFNQIGRTGILRVSAATNQALATIQVYKEKIVPEYLLTFLNYHVGYWKLVASSSRKDPNITSKDIQSFPLIIPALEEQTAIATLLTDMDTEITQLQQRRHKTHALKQGMMQQLLTGKIRLI